MLAATTKNRSVSMALPGPTRPSHQPGDACPGPTSPMTWLSPVRACVMKTPLDASALSTPQDSYAILMLGSTNPDSRLRSPMSTNCREPGKSPSRHAPVTGEGSADGYEVTTSLRRTRLRGPREYPRYLRGRPRDGRLLA